MSDEAPATRPAFSPRVILAVVMVGVVSFAALVVLGVYPPDLRSGNDGRAHALSKSAIGYAGAPILMKALGETTMVSRVRRRDLKQAVLVLTPDVGARADALARLGGAASTVIVLPKWAAAPDVLHEGFVRKAGLLPGGKAYQGLLKAWSPNTRVVRRKDAGRPVLRGAGGPFAPGTYLPLGAIDRLQTVSGEGWAPALVDETGGVVLAYSRRHPEVLLLADPDLLNNQGLKSLDTARAGAAVLQAASSGGARAIVFDVTLAGYERGRGLMRMMLEPPWLAATLIGVAAAVLMGLHGLARFGQPRRMGRAYALGARALADNTAGLIRLARKEHEMAPAYAELVRAEVARASGAHAEPGWLDELARRRGLAAPDELAAEAEAAKTRDDLLAVARKLYDWRGEMTRERR